MLFLKNHFSILLLFISIASNAQFKETFFTLNPTLTPNAEAIIFSYEGDLWKVATEGGDAY